MKRLVSLGVVLLVVFALLSVLGTGGEVDKKYWRVTQAGPGQLALRITAPEAGDHIEIYYPRGAGCFKVVSCLVINQPPVPIRVTSRNHCDFRGGKSILDFTRLLNNGDAVICTLTKDGVTEAELIEYITDPDKLIKKIHISKTK